MLNGFEAQHGGATDVKPYYVFFCLRQGPLSAEEEAF